MDSTNIPTNSSRARRFLKILSSHEPTSLSKVTFTRINSRLAAAITGRSCTRATAVATIIDAIQHTDDTAFLAEVAPQVASGQIKYREDIRQGIESVPACFSEMLRGDNFGKMIVQIAPDPTR